MILRPLETDGDTGNAFSAAWQIVERLQKQRYETCWMITQPSHAALAGQIAAHLQGPQVPKLDADLVRAIALHDSGWGMTDAEAVMHSRSSQHTPPMSFLQVGAADFLVAWTQSIDIVQPICPAGGYIVSRHFCRLAESRLPGASDHSSDQKSLKHFLHRESERQRKLETKQNRSGQELELLTDLLQFCDLLSLYFCSGAHDKAEFPECFGVKMRLSVEEDGYKLEPALIERGSKLSVAALRHPATKEQSGQELAIKIL